MALGFPWGTPERAQCGVHAAYLRVVGDSEWHCEEHLPHLAAGCALFQSCPYPCHCWDSLLTAVRRGRKTVYTHLSWHFLIYLEACHMLFLWLQIAVDTVASIMWERRVLTWCLFIWYLRQKNHSKGFLLSLILASASADAHRVPQSRSSTPTEFLSIHLPFSCHLSHCPLFSLGIPTHAPSSFFLDLLFSLWKPKQSQTTRCGLGCKGGIAFE